MRTLLFIILSLPLFQDLFGQSFVNLKPLIGSEVSKPAELFNIMTYPEATIATVPEVTNNDTTDTFIFPNTADSRKVKISTSSTYYRGTIAGLVVEIDSLEKFKRPNSSVFYQLCTEWQDAPAECITIAPSMIKPLGENLYQVSFQTIYNFNKISFLFASNSPSATQPILHVKYFFVAKGLSNCDVKITKTTVKDPVSFPNVGIGGSVIIQTKNAIKSDRYQPFYNSFYDYFTFETPPGFNQPIVNDTVTAYNTFGNYMRFRFEGNNSCYKDTVIRAYVRPCIECPTPAIQKLVSDCNDDYQLNISYQGSVQAVQYILAEEGFTGTWTSLKESPLTLKKGIKYQLQLYYGRWPIYSSYQFFEPITGLCTPITVVKIRP